MVRDRTITLGHISKRTPREKRNYRQPGGPTIPLLLQSKISPFAPSWATKSVLPSAKALTDGDSEKETQAVANRQRGRCDAKATQVTLLRLSLGAASLKGLVGFNVTGRLD